MTGGRRIGLVLAVLLGLSGCRAAGTGSLSLHPRPHAPTASLDVQEFIAEHNRNAERIQSLEAKPSIILTSGRRQAPLQGRMALERPRNFKLELSTIRSTAADIGSNDQEFWFWVSNDEDKAIYWCNHSDLGSSPLPVTYQPDWIIEALGLKPISPEEAEQIRVQPGPYADTTALVFPTTRNQGGSSTRVMIVSNDERTIKEYRLYTPDLKTVIAQAVPSRYKAFPTASSDADSASTCRLPEKIRLDWKRDQLVLDVALREVTLNQFFDASRRASLFVEPDLPGYTRRNLAELGRGSRPDRRPTIRQTMPQPEPSSGVQLGQPAPMSDDAPVVPKLGRTTVRPKNTLPLLPQEELVGAPAPTPPVSRAAQAANAELTQVDSFGISR